MKKGHFNIGFDLNKGNQYGRIHSEAPYERKIRIILIENKYGNQHKFVHYQLA